MWGNGAADPKSIGDTSSGSTSPESANIFGFMVYDVILPDLPENSSMAEDSPEMLGVGAAKPKSVRDDLPCSTS